MKKIIVLFCLALSVKAQSQSILKREEDSSSVSIITTRSDISENDNNYDFIAKGIIFKDTNNFPLFLASFSFNSPRNMSIDSSDEIEFDFCDGKIFSFPRNNFEPEDVEKDSLANFTFKISYECLVHMGLKMVNEFIITTKYGTDTVRIADKFKLVIPNTANLLLKVCGEENDKIYDYKTSHEVEFIVDSLSERRNIDKKYFGKYTGEWNGEWGGNNLVYTFELTLKKDTSYFLWKQLIPGSSKESEINKQVVNVITGKDSNHLLLTVVFDENHPETTGDLRKFDLKLSEDGKMIYGESYFNGVYFGKYYGIKKGK